MKKDRLTEILAAERFTETELKEISALVDKYPWFNIARFLKLKAMHQLNYEYSEELGKSAVFSSDRKHLYHWINNEIEKAPSSGLKRTELEFIGSNEDADIASATQDAFELAHESEEFGEKDMEDMIGIAVKEDTDMEDFDIEEDVAFPAIDQIKEVEDSDEIVDVEEADDIVDVKKNEESAPDREEAMPIIDAELLLKEAPNEEPVGKEEESPNLIERFIRNEPGVIPADKQTTLSGDAAAGSIKESDSFITDTLAQIYIKQGLFAKAIYAYERLSLKYPEKSAYFAAQIEKIEYISHS